MKTCKLVTLVIALFFAPILNAQPDYRLHTSMETYTDLVSPLVLNSPDSIAEGFFVAGSVMFPVYDMLIDFNQVISVPSAGAYVTRHGYVAVYEYPSYAYTMVFHGAYSNYRKRDQNSSISVKYEGVKEHGILKFQWKNMGITGRSDDDYVNFQVWFNEQDKSISYHYGPSHITGNFSPVIGFFRAPNDFSEITHACYIGGSSSMSSSLTLGHPARFDDIGAVDGFPPEGSVYSFRGFTTAAPGAASASMTVEAWPNPASDVLNVTCPDAGAAISLFDMRGKEMNVSVAKPNGSGSAQIDVGNLAAGIYLLRVTSGKQVLLRKVQVQ